MTLHSPGGTVPPIDSTDNDNISDAVGNKLDTEAGDSVLARLVVPLVDQGNNDWISDGIGNKGDTVAGSSLFSLARVIIADVATAIADIATAIADIATVDAAVAAVDAAVVVVDGYHDVPAVDSAANAQMRDVLGQKGDTHDGDSAMARLHTFEEHIHSPTMVLPDRGGSIPATAAGGAWTYGVESATLGTPGDDFDIHWVEIVANNNDQYQARISVDGTPVTEFTFERVAASTRSFTKPVQTAVLGAGSITVALASAAGGSTANFKVEYHTY
jgi:hypothetical protein